MSSFPSLPLFTDAFIADTGHLNAQETGAYLMLLMVAWRTPECRLPENDDKLARWARVDRRTWLRIKPTVMEFWTLADGFWTQKRLAKEREIVSKRAEVARRNGEQGGRPKSLENKDVANPTGSPRVTQKKAPNPIPKETPVVPKGTLLAEFAEWWPLYPKRKGTNSRAAAEELYVRARQSGVEREVLFAAVRRYASEVRRDGKEGTEFVKQAESFLSARKRLWEDYAAKAAQSNSSGDAAEPPVGRQAEVAAYVATWSDDRWREEVRMWRGRGGHWPWRHMTPAPDDPRTAVPRHILAEANIHPARAAA